MSRQSGFSLVELSIVLVILGLLVGGILTGQSLIRAAELRSVTTEYNQFQTAVMTFRDKYFALPGDMRNATDFWGAAHATPATCITTASTGTETCNGDGDGVIGVITGSNERFRFWQQLANAGLIEGSYTGIEGSSGNTEHAVPGTNVPASKLSSGTWHTKNWGAISGAGALFDGTYEDVMIFGGAHASSEPVEDILIPEEAWNIDKKIDDGLPATGKLVVRVRADCTNATSAAGDSDNFDSTYLLTSTSLACAFVFKEVY